MISARQRPIADLQQMMRRAYAGKRELTLPPAAQRPNLVPVRLMGHTRFSPKETNFPLFLPEGQGAKPKKQGAAGVSMGRAFATTKSPAMPGS